MSRSRTWSKVSICAATALAPLVAAAPVHATSKCVGQYCLNVETRGEKEVYLVQMATSSKAADKRNVYVSLTMWDGQDRVARQFQGVWYDRMPKAVDHAIYTYAPIWVTYCNQYVNVLLPKAPVTKPCAKWSPGYKLGGYVYENNVKVATFKGNDALIIK